MGDAFRVTVAKEHFLKQPGLQHFGKHFLNRQNYKAGLFYKISNLGVGSTKRSEKIKVVV